MLAALLNFILPMFWVMSKYKFNLFHKSSGYQKLPSKHLLVLKTSPRSLQDMPWRFLQRLFRVTILRLARRLEDLLEDKKLLRWRRLQDVFKTCLGDVSKRCLENMPWRCQNTSWGYLYETNLNVYLTNLYFTKLYLTFLRRIQKALIRTHHFNILLILELEQHLYFRD